MPTITVTKLNDIQRLDQTKDADTEIASYLNSHFSNIESLGNCKNELSLKQSELSNVDSELAKLDLEYKDLVKQSFSTSKMLIHQLESLQSSGLDVAEAVQKFRQLETTTTSGTTPAMSHLKELCTKLMSLKASKDYFLYLSEILRICDKLKSGTLSPKENIETLQLLGNTALSVDSNNGGLSSCQYLKEYIKSVYINCHTIVKEDVTRKVAEQLKELGWPRPIVLDDLKSTATLKKLRSLQTAFSNLYQFYQQYFYSLISDNYTMEKNLPGDGLKSMEMIMKPIIIRFKYHFCENRPTNRLDKPEWFFVYSLNLIRDHSPFLENVIDPLLEPLQNDSYTTSKDAFISSIINAIVVKLKEDVEKIITTPQFLIHTLREAINFDKVVRSTHFYQSHIPDKEWRGCFEKLLEDPEVLQHYISAERQAASAKYKEILEREDTWEIHTFSIEEIKESPESQPTHFSEEMIDLLENITDLCKDIRDPEIQLKIVLELHITILSGCVDDLCDIVDKLEFGQFNFSHQEKRGDGNQTIGMLCRVLLSLSYVVSILKEWEVDLFFVELYEEMKKMEMLQGKHHRSLFGKVIKRFQKLSSHIEEIISQHVARQVISKMVNYKARDWTFNSNGGISLSHELYEPLFSFSSLSSLIGAVLPSVLHTKIFKNVANLLDGFLFKHVILQNIFSYEGGKQLLHDMQNGFTSQQSMKRVQEACTILCLPSATNPKAVNFDWLMFVLSDEELSDMERKKMVEEKLQIYGLSLDEMKDVASKRII